MFNNRVNEIDLLRFVAAISVVIFHYSFRGYAADNLSVMPYPTIAFIGKYGYLGVQLFFLISGFVILMTASNKNLAGFIKSRFNRLYPIFWVCCTITYVFILLLGKPRFHATFIQYTINMTMISGFIFIDSIDGVYWSLFIEMQFYALVGGILLIKQIHRAQHFFILWLIATLILEIFPFGSVEIIRYLLITDYSVYFIAGAIMYLVWKNGVTLMRVMTIVLSWLLALYQSFKSLTDFEKQFKTSINGFVVALVITLFFIAMVLIALRRTGLLGRRRWLMAGALTYPLYLIHQNIGYIIFQAFYPAINPHVLFWSTIILMIVTAHIINLVVEKYLLSNLIRIQELAMSMNLTKSKELAHKAE